MEVLGHWVLAMVLAGGAGMQVGVLESWLLAGC